MADDKKNIPEAAPPAEAPAPEPALTDAEAVMLEHEGQAALFEMGEAVPDPADAVTRAEVEEPTAPEVPKAEKEQAQPPDPGRDDPAPAHSGKVVDFAAACDEAAKEEKKAIKQKLPKEKGKAAKPGKGRPPKAEKTAPEQVKLEMSRNVQSGNTQNLKSMVIQRSFPKWSVAERRKTAAASDQAAVCACAHSRYFAGGSPSGLRV